jgi:hypothetical protein
MLLILNACRLFDRKFDSTFWKTIKISEVPKVIRRQEAAFASMIGAQRAQCLALFARVDLNEILGYVLERSSETSCLRLEPIGLEILQLLFAELLDNTSGSDNFLSVWNVALTVLDNVEFKTVDQRRRKIITEGRRKIIESFVRKASFRSLQHYDTFSRLYDGVSPSHRDFNVTKDVISRVLADDLLLADVDWCSLDQLLSSSTADLMACKRMTTALIKFVEKTMSVWASFEDKLRFLDRLHAKFVGESWANEKQILSFLSTAVRATDSPVSALSTSLNVAAKEPGLFRELQITALKRVAQTILPETSARAIVHRPDLLCKFDFSDPTVSDAKFYHALLQHSRISLLLQCNGAQEAARLYCAAMDGRPSPCWNTRELVDYIFSAYFWRWKPSSFSDFSPQHKEVIETLFSKSHCQPDEDSDCSNRFSLNSCREHVKDIVDAWLHQFETENVTRYSLEHAAVAFQAGLWRALEDFYEVKLPREAMVAAKLNELSTLEASIERSLSVSVADKTMPVHDVLRDYSCVPETGSEVERLLRDHAGLPQHAHDAKSFCGQQRTLVAIRRDHHLSMAFAKENEEVLFLCTYFLISPSMLFKDAVFREQHTVDSLKQTVDEARSWLRTIFGPESHFGGVLSAWKVLSALETETDVRLELESIAKCSLLGINTEDVENFRAIATLCQISRPLKRFIHCCVHFDFAVASKDSFFTELEKISQQFYDEDPAEKTVDVCLASLRKICSLVSPRGLGNDSSLHDSRSALLEILPVLELLATVFSYPEVWMYASEMQWFGEDGLKRFYVEYGNVTNVLLGNSKSYEMSVLDALEPTMRLVSTLGSLRGINVMLVLLTTLSENEDVRDSLGESMARDMRQVHNRISEIRDWFSHGVDEVAAAHSLYDAVVRSGSYSIECRGDAESPETNEKDDASSKEGSLSMVLQFLVKKGEVREHRALGGHALNQFMQQLSLLQNENESKSAEMEKFVEQYQILSCAARNLLGMRSMGYDKMPFSDFRCRVGSMFFEDANQLLKDSELHMRSFKEWLTNVREGYPVSVLFWTEELREIHTLMKSLSNGEIRGTVEVLNEKILRLKPLCREELGHDSINGTLGKILASKEGQLAKTGSWLISVSKFLDSFVAACGSVEDTAGSSSRSKIILHSLACEEAEESLAVLDILQFIYGVSSFECQ